jgi:Calcineurin-like phosphoesterase
MASRQMIGSKPSIASGPNLPFLKTANLSIESVRRSLPRCDYSGYPSLRLVTAQRRARESMGAAGFRQPRRWRATALAASGANLVSFRSIQDPAPHWAVGRLAVRTPWRMIVARITRRHTLGIGVGAGLSVTMLSGSEKPADAAPNNATFSLLLVNDIYKSSDNKGRGGFAKLAAVVKSERARGIPMLFCHAGDAFSPSLLSGFDQGAHIVELTNLIRPDVFVPGNHEFDFGVDVFRQRMREANFPFFAANIRQQDGSPFPGIPELRTRPCFRWGLSRSAWPV